MDTKNEPTPLPRLDDDRVIAATAKELAPFVREWLKDDDRSIDQIEAELIDAIEFDNDGYAIAKRLDDRSGYTPDAELVSILDDCSRLKSNELEKLIVEWIAANEIANREKEKTK